MRATRHRHGARAAIARTTLTLIAALATVESGSADPSLVDPETPPSLHTVSGLPWQYDSPTTPFDLVFSDEFNDEGRQYTPEDAARVAPHGQNHTRKWSATTQLAGGDALGDTYYSPYTVTTGDGDLQITASHHRVGSARFVSGQLSSWNRVCFQGGYLEVRYQPPGPAGKQQDAVWTGIWTLGNLARSQWTGSGDGFWPFSYSECDGAVPYLAGTSPQRVSACDVQRGRFGMHPRQGRGAVELDMIESVHVGTKCAPLGMEMRSCAQAALQVAPRIPPSYRPFVLGPLKAVPPPGLTSGPESWYRDTSYGPPRAPTYKALNGGVVPIAAGSAAVDTVAASRIINDSTYLAVPRQYHTLGLRVEIADVCLEAPPLNASAAEACRQHSWYEFFFDDESVMRMNGTALGAYVSDNYHPDTPNRVFPSEPLYVLIDMKFTKQIPLYWSDPELVDPDFTMFPMTFRVDYVRLWQERGKERTSCSPADHPTNGWIRGHHVDYGVRGESLLGAGVWVGMALVVAALAMALGGSTANMHLTAVAVQLAPLGILILWSVLSALGLDPNSPLYYVWWLQAVGVSAAVGSMFPDSTHVLGGASAAGLVGLLLAIDLGVDEGVGRIEGQGRIAAAFLGSALAGLLTFTLMHLRFRRGVVQAFSSALVGGVALTFGIALLTSCGEGAFDGGECGLGNVDVCLKGIRSNDCDGGFSNLMLTSGLPLFIVGVIAQLVNQIVRHAPRPITFATLCAARTFWIALLRKRKVRKESAGSPPPLGRVERSHRQSGAVQLVTPPDATTPEDVEVGPADSSGDGERYAISPHPYLPPELQTSSGKARTASPTLRSQGSDFAEAVEALRRTSVDTGERLAQLRAVGAHYAVQLGLQDAVVANQVAHLHALIEGHMGSNPAQREQQLADAAAAVARRLLETYAHWCLRLHEPPRAASSIHDALLYLLIWGEGANLRHMPELLCFLYHKVHAAVEHAKPADLSAAAAGTAEPPPARQSSSCDSFLDDVVTPIYEIVSQRFKDRVNYDDINEFFWYRGCLGFQPFRKRPNPIATALAVCRKTHMESNSWLHALHCFIDVAFVVFGLAVFTFALALNSCVEAPPDLQVARALLVVTLLPIRALLVELFDLWAESAVASNLDSDTSLVGQVSREAQFRAERHARTGHFRRVALARLFLFAIASTVVGVLGVAASTAAADPRSLASGLFGAGDESEKLPVRIAFFVACGLWIVGQVTSWGEYGVLPFQIRTRKNVEQKKVGLWALCGIFESPYRSNRLNERFFKGGQPSNRLGGLYWLLLLTLAGALMFYLVCAKVAEGFVTVTITSYSVFSPLEYLALWLCMMLPLPFISMLILDQLFTWVLALTAAALSVLMKQRGGMPLKHLGTAKHAYDFGVNCVAPVWRHASTPKHAQLVETWNAIVAALRVDDLLTDAEASALSCESEAVRQLSDGADLLDAVASEEARRRLSHFAHSLRLEMPAPPPVDEMRSFSMLVPVYSETVLFSADELAELDVEGVALLDDMKSTYAQEWANFCERTKVDPATTGASLLAAATAHPHGTGDEAAHVEEVRLWASLRGQTLARTVRGLSQYEDALLLQARLEAPEATEEARLALVRRKCQLVVACQKYGDQKKAGDAKADDVETLLARFPCLRVAYLEVVKDRRAAPNGAEEEAEVTTRYSSVLVRKSGGAVEELSRVALPGNPILGEGKPENQNLGMAFTTGECVTMVDMNQDGYFEEALKMRNLLEEFRAADPSPGGERPVTIVGFPEHVFTQSSGFVTAIYAAMQERFFGTWWQRVQVKLDIRAHYGHPDVLDKLHFMTRGGCSKASKEINLSEDVFAGYKTMLRGGRVVHVEYHQLGKGRMTNLSEVNGFFAKLSQGAACQLMSRDLYRLNRALPPDRALSLFFSGFGFYICTAARVLTMQARDGTAHLPHPASFSHLPYLSSRCSCSRTRSPSSRSPASSARLWGCRSPHSRRWRTCRSSSPRRCCCPRRCWCSPTRGRGRRGTT